MQKKLRRAEQKLAKLELNDIFEKIVDECISIDAYKLVTNFSVYFDEHMIEKPMNLNEMKEIANEKKYSDKEEFLSDFHLLIKYANANYS